jgi:hypothetical protein
MTKLMVNGFPKVTRRLDLSGFAQYMRDQGVDEESAVAVEDALSDSYLSVWLNHNQQFRDAWLDWNVAVEEGQAIVKQLQNEGLQKSPDAAKIARLTEQLNKQNAATLALGREVQALLWGCKPEEVGAVYELSTELGQWVDAMAWGYVAEYRGARKKDAAR